MARGRRQEVELTPSSAVASKALPVDSSEVREIIRQAKDAGTSLRLVGTGTWLEAGRPVAAVERLPLGGLTGIVAYTPGDLTITARAGTSLAEIDRVTTAEGQWLGLDPAG